MKPATRVLRDTTKKRDELRQSQYWNEVIPSRCPPVLWFGNHKQENKIVTVGLNPSYGEFFKNQEDAREGRYLEPSEQRFYVYSEKDLENIEDPTVLNNVLQSYDRYFNKNPYTRWFGKPGGYNVELFINQLDASFYGEKQIGCVHIDLFPFVTTEKFSDLNRQQIYEAFNDSWFREHHQDLVSYLKPKLIIAFGRSTVELLNQHFDYALLFDREFKHNNRRYAKYSVAVQTISGANIPITGLSVNLGNPRGFSKKLLKMLSKQITQSPKFERIEIWKTLPFLEYPISNELLDLALRHEDNHELAILGDAILNVAVREHYYEKGKTAEMIQCKDKTYGSNDHLYKISSQKMKLQNHIISSSGLLDNPEINEVHARTLEAIIGAIYKENGIIPAKKFIEQWIIPTNYSLHNRLKLT